MFFRKASSHNNDHDCLTSLISLSKATSKAILAITNKILSFHTAWAERRQDTISDYRKYLQKELKQTSKPHNTKRKGNKAKTERMFDWYREYRKAGFGNEESRINVACKAKLHRLTKTELTEHQIKRRFDDRYGEDHDAKVLAEYQPD